MFYMTQIFKLLFLFRPKKKFVQNWTSNAVFTIGVPVKNAFLGSCHNFQEIFSLPFELIFNPHIGNHQT